MAHFDKNTAMDGANGQPRWQWRRLRTLVLRDGTVLSAFKSDAHATHTVILEPSGHAYSYVHPNGKVSRHLTPTSLTAHRPLVIETLRLRNQHCSLSEQRLKPYVHSAVLPQDQSFAAIARQHGLPLRARWPARSSVFRVAVLWNERSGCFEIESMDGLARVRLRPNGLLAEFSFACPVQNNTDDPPRLSKSATLVWIDQVCAVASVPLPFQYPLLILTHARATLVDGGSEFELPGDERELEAVSMLPENGAFAARPTFSVIDEPDHRGQQQNVRGRLSLSDITRVATLPSASFYRQVLVEVLEDITIHVLPKSVLLVDHHATRSLVDCQRGFFRLFDVSGSLKHRFTAEAIPPLTLKSANQTPRSISSICEHISHIARGLANDVTRTLQQSSTSVLETTQPPPKTLIEETSTDQGRFRAYADGTIRVAFRDRTILELDAGKELCEVMFPDGSDGKFTISSAPVPVQPYVRLASEFREWAYASPSERMARHVEKLTMLATAQQELQRIQAQCGINDHTRHPLSWTAAVPVPISHAGDPIRQRSDRCESKDVQIQDMSLPSIRLLQQQTQAHMATVKNLLERADCVTVFASQSRTQNASD